MFDLRCPVRNCENLLRRRADGLTCPRGHHFDQAKQGYWALLQPQDRRSAHAGDCDAAVLARHRWLANGNAESLIEELRRFIADSRTADGDRLPSTARDGRPRILDLGCGEGTFGRALFPADADGYCGIDLSKRAIKLAARGWPSATWVVANADRILPVADASVDLVLSFFGRRPGEEVRRVLKPLGSCIVAVPGEEDLIELRERVQQAGHRRSRWERVVEELACDGFDFVEHRSWTEQLELDNRSIADALAMTYRGVRHSEQKRLECVDSMKVTLAADLVMLRRV